MLSTDTDCAGARPRQARTRLRAAFACFDALAVVVLVALWSLVPTAPAYAYVDPSVMTYTIQALAGLVVALSAVIGVAFRRTRRKLYDMFNVDENAHKICEGPIGRIDPSAEDAQQRLEAASDAASSQAAQCNALSGDMQPLSQKARVGIALLVCVFVAFIVFIAPALEIFGSNGDSLVFGLGTIWWIPVVFCLAIAVLTATALSFLKTRAFFFAMTALFALGVASYVQSMFLNGGMMPADGGFISWDSQYFVARMIVSGVIWIGFFVATFALGKLNARVFLRAISAAACVLIVIQLVGVASIALDPTKTSVSEQHKPYVTKEALFTVSPKSNVIVFVLDTYDTEILEQIRAEDPHTLDSFEDFTYFPNSVGTMIPTTNAIPNMLTGLKPEPGQDIAEYRRTKYEKGTFIDDIYNRDYSIGIYTDSLMMDFGNPADRAVTEKTLNVHPVDQAPLDIWSTFVAMEQCALYREAPWVLKPAFWYYTSDINNRMIADREDVDLADSLYELDDAAILKLMRKRGLEVADDEKAGSFRFIHLFGPHFPYSIDEEGNAIGTNQSDQIAQAKGSMKVVEEYLGQLKDLGLYDSATIIVTADHGIWSLTEDPVQAPISPIMLAKPTRKGGDTANPRHAAEISEAPVSHGDIQATVIAAMGGDKTPYGTTLFEVSDPNRVRYFDALTNAGDQGQHFVEYAVQGDALDLSSWKKTGNTWNGA